MAFTCFKRQQILTCATNQFSGVFFLTGVPLLVFLYSFCAQISSRAPNMTEIMMLDKPGHQVLSLQPKLCNICSYCSTCTNSDSYSFIALARARFVLRHYLSKHPLDSPIPPDPHTLVTYPSAHKQSRRQVA